MPGPLRKADTPQAERLHRFAHDLRNRLAGIQQVLQQLKDADGAEELVGFAEQQYFKAMRETESLLDDLGVERGIGAIVREPVDLGGIVRECIASLDHRFQRKEQTVRATGELPGPVPGDAHWLRELVSALLTNASKFSPKGSAIDVTLTTDGDHAVLTVADQGVGLSGDDLRNVFVRYAWLESRSTDGEPQGRGTLARAKQWATAHGGTLEAASDGPEKGAVFTLRLPLG